VFSTSYSPFWQCQFSWQWVFPFYGGASFPSGGVFHFCLSAACEPLVPSSQDVSKFPVENGGEAVGAESSASASASTSCESREGDLNPSFATSPLGATSDIDQEETSESDSEDIFSPSINQFPDLQLPSGSFLTATLKAIVNADRHPQNSQDTTTSDDSDDHDFALLRKAIFFPHRANHLFNETDLTFLQDLFPEFPKLPDSFRKYLDTHKEFIEKRNPCALPGYPSARGGEAGALSVAEVDEWFYIHAAAVHFQRHFAKIEKLSLSHGEGWTDVNIWAHLLDTAFLYSSTLSLDRKELQSNIHDAVITVQKSSYDGILRNSRITKKTSRLDIGFIEVKPARTPYPKDSATDRLKVIKAMRSSLLNLISIVKHDHGNENEKSEVLRKIVVVGVICNGTSMTVLQAWNLSSKLLFFKENEYDLTMETLPLLIETCWRLKLALEMTLDSVLQARSSGLLNQPL